MAERSEWKYWPSLILFLYLLALCLELLETLLRFDSCE